MSAAQWRIVSAQNRFTMLYRVCDKIKLVPIRFKRMDLGQVVSTFDTAAGDRDASETLGFAVRGWPSVYEAILSQLELILLKVIVGQRQQPRKWF